MLDQPEVQAAIRKVDQIFTSIEGDGREVVGIRQRLKDVETIVERIDVHQQIDKPIERIAKLEDLVLAINEDRKRWKAWAAGLAVGLGITSVTGIVGLIAQFSKFATSGP